MGVESARVARTSMPTVFGLRKKTGADLPVRAALRRESEHVELSRRRLVSVRLPDEGLGEKPVCVAQDRRAQRGVA